MRLVRGLVVWLGIIVTETAHGIARTLVLQPIVGEFRSRQIGVLTGCSIILAIAMLTVRWVRPASATQAIWIGLLWLVLTLAFEVAFGRYVVRASWTRILSDYNLASGGLLPLGLLVLAAAPWIAARVRHVI